MILSFRRTFGLSWAIVMMMALMATLTSVQSQTATPPTSARYVDQTKGMTADEAVAYTLAHTANCRPCERRLTLLAQWSSRRVCA